MKFDKSEYIPEYRSISFATSCSMTLTDTEFNSAIQKINDEHGEFVSMAPSTYAVYIVYKVLKRQE